MGFVALQIFIASTAAFLTAGRFGLAPTAKKHTKAGLKLYDDDSEGEQWRKHERGHCTNGLMRYSASRYLKHAGYEVAHPRTGLTTSDPGGYTAVDVLVGGSQGHVVATGVVLGLRAIGAL